MDEAAIRTRLKELIIQDLNLEGRRPEDLEDAAPLFGKASALGLDSLDALQLATGIEETFGVRVPEGDGAKEIFRSIDTLVAHIAGARPAG